MLKNSSLDFLVRCVVMIMSIQYLFRSRNLAINSPLGHFNKDNADSPPQKYQTHETHGDIQSSIPPTTKWPSLKYSKQNPSHVRRQTLPSQPSQLPHNSISSQYSQPFHESCSTMSKPDIPCSKYKLFPNTFRLSPSYFFIILSLFTLKT